MGQGPYFIKKLKKEKKGKKRKKKEKEKKGKGSILYYKIFPFRCVYKGQKKPLREKKDDLMGSDVCLVFSD